MEALKYHSDGPVKIHEKSVWLGGRGSTEARYGKVVL